MGLLSSSLGESQIGFSHSPGGGPEPHKLSGGKTELQTGSQQENWILEPPHSMVSLEEGSISTAEFQHILKRMPRVARESLGLALCRVYLEMRT